jgi:hypothetical protein
MAILVDMGEYPKDFDVMYTEVHELGMFISIHLCMLPVAAPREAPHTPRLFRLISFKYQAGLTGRLQASRLGNRFPKTVD